MKVTNICEDLIFIAVMVLSQLLYAILLIVGVIQHVWVAFIPTILFVGIMSIRYGVMMVKLLIIAIKERIRKNNETETY